MVEKPSFRTVSLRSELVEEVEKFIEKHPVYRSIADFISEAVRLRLQALRSSRPDVGAAQQIMREVEEMAR